MGMCFQIETGWAMVGEHLIPRLTGDSVHDYLANGRDWIINGCKWQLTKLMLDAGCREDDLRFETTIDALGREILVCHSGKL